jgi:hypothetical protein
MSGSGAAPAARRVRSYVSAGVVRWLASAVLFIGVIAAVGGVAYAVNGATQAGGYVDVPVKARTVAGLTVPDDPSDPRARVALRDASGSGGAVRLDLAGKTSGSWLEADTGALTLRSFDSTVAEQLSSRGGVAVLGLCVGAGALLLRRLLLSIAQGEPFRAGNAARVAGIAGLIVVASLGAAVLPSVAAGLVLGRLGLAGSGTPVTTTFAFPYVPLVVALLLLALAEAFRHGTELARDVEGLV